MKPWLKSTVLVLVTSLCFGFTKSVFIIIADSNTLASLTMQKLADYSSQFKQGLDVCILSTGSQNGASKYKHEKEGFQGRVSRKAVKQGCQPT